MTWAFAAAILCAGLAFEVTRAYAVLGVLAMAGVGGTIMIRTAVSVDRGLREARDAVEAAVDTHLETLARRRLNLVTRDHYGVLTDGGWDAEIDHFLDNVVAPELGPEGRRALFGRSRRDGYWQRLIEEPVFARARAIDRQLAFTETLSPAEFERWCEKMLAKAGWRTTATGASGDQGADVLAEKNGVVAVLQCKLYGSPVGNKAVQEAFSAQRHYRADLAAVVTNAAYTPSARALAESTGVLLLHQSDMDQFDALAAARA
ncbi:restriction endonuclease [Chthonobacter rhizosphaerae]|uniref:restriction endonuclease n=1 Tax=Chthonobacter rhizosphaerae TaxID=2735553 RepID=UPI001FE476AA|nr:restriction endonuclease [Chthonobacter rhizosphaerae]